MNIFAILWDLPVTLDEIRIKAQVDTFITEKKKNQVRGELKDEK